MQNQNGTPLCVLVCKAVANLATIKRIFLKLQQVQSTHHNYRIKSDTVYSFTATTITSHNNTYSLACTHTENKKILRKLNLLAAAEQSHLALGYLYATQVL